jgi:hypothetical protein
MPDSFREGRIYSVIRPAIRTKVLAFKSVSPPRNKTYEENSGKKTVKKLLFVWLLVKALRLICVESQMGGNFCRFGLSGIEKFKELASR